MLNSHSDDKLLQISSAESHKLAEGSREREIDNHRLVARSHTGGCQFLSLSDDECTAML